MKQAVNPFLPLNEYIPDGEPHVFGDRVYLFGSHDRAGGDRYCMNDYVCYSADLHNLADWQYEGVIYRKDQDPGNPDGSHCLWAPDVVRGTDGRYYLYYCMDVLPEIGVAVCDSPAGAYCYLGHVHYPDGVALGRREGDFIQFDPAVFIDDDQSVYLYSGNASREKGDPVRKNSQVMKLAPDMLTITEPPKPLIPTMQNSEGTDFEGHEFFEASSLRKINGRYYFIYSDVPDYALCYAVSSYPDRDFKFGGRLISLGDTGYRGRKRGEALCHYGNIHGSLEWINEQWYVFYHRQTNRTQFSRQACAEKIEILPDGSIPQVEMTSCGLNEGALAGAGEYSAGIACNLSGRNGTSLSVLPQMEDRYPYLTQEGEDGDPRAFLYIKNITDGSRAGYKYFSFTGRTQISMTVRGKAKGRFLILSDEGEKAVGEIPVDLTSGEWTAVSGSVNGLDGTCPLFLVYMGDGCLDFRSFELHVT